MLLLIQPAVEVQSHILATLSRLLGSTRLGQVGNAFPASESSRSGCPWDSLDATSAWRSTAVFLRVVPTPRCSRSQIALAAFEGSPTALPERMAQARCGVGWGGWGGFGADLPAKLRSPVARHYAKFICVLKLYRERQSALTAPAAIKQLNSSLASPQKSQSCPIGAQTPARLREPFRTQNKFR